MLLMVNWVLATAVGKLHLNNLELETKYYYTSGQE